MNGSYQDCLTPLGSKTFTIEDQKLFAQYTGDLNPIHIDPIFARKTLAGECIVYGIFGVMWAFNQLIKIEGLYPQSFDAQFLKTIPLNKPITCLWDKLKSKIIIVQDRILLTSILIKIGDVSKDDHLNIMCKAPDAEPKNPLFKDISINENMPLYFRGDLSCGKKLFPELNTAYGDGITSELACTSEIIGMQIPGLNSLFLRIRGSITSNWAAPKCCVTQVDSRASLIKISFEGSHLKCELSAIFRPPPHKPKHIKDLSIYVKSDEFKGINALIIGGSRGIGRLTAKLLASGGAKIVLTYATGENDAFELQEELKNHGFACNVKKFIIGQDITLPIESFDQIYYFPTPKIAKESGDNNNDLFKKYQHYYVSCFENILDLCQKNKLSPAIFYPSTDFIDSNPGDFKNYINAKKNGEQICKNYKEKYHMKIIYPRLPRLETDQTTSIFPEKFQDSTEVMLPYLRIMTA